MSGNGAQNADGDVYVEPAQLRRQALQFTRMGERLDPRYQQAVDQPRPAQLGTAPPARWLAQRLAELSGPDGLVDMLRTWSVQLTDVGENQLAAVLRYYLTDEAGAAALHEIRTTMEPQ